MAVIIVDDIDAAENGNPPTQPGNGTVVNEAPAGTGQAPQEETIPEKFRGKQLNDILKSYEDMEKLVGRQGAELGELRKTHDEVIRSYIAQVKPSATAGSTKQEIPEDDDTEFFVNPKAAIEKAVLQHPEIQKLRQSQMQTTAERALNQLASKHSDWREVMTSPEFNNFVSANPIHVQLLQQADRNFDVNAADYVLSQFKASRSGSQAPSAPHADTAREATEAARRAAVSASKVPSGAAAPSSDGGKPFYRRQDLVRKMQKDPEWYAANAEEILLAYQEKRVR